jgi:hypothetical protein
LFPALAPCRDLEAAEEVRGDVASLILAGLSALSSFHTSSHKHTRHHHQQQHWQEASSNEKGRWHLRGSKGHSSDAEDEDEAEEEERRKRYHRRGEHRRRQTAGMR